MKRFVLISLLFVFVLASASSQTVYTIKDAPPKLLKSYKKATDKKYDLKPQKKIDQLNKIIAKYPGFVDAYSEKAYALYSQGKVEEAKNNLEQAISIMPDYKPRKYLILANYCQMLEEYTCEEKNLRSFLSYKESSKLQNEINKRLNSIALRKQLEQVYGSIELEKLGSGINSEKYAEYKPVLSIDGQEMVFTRRMPGPVGMQEDFYRSVKENGIWQEAQPIAELNTDGNEGSHCISPDGKWMIYTRCDAPDQYKSCDLYISKKEGTKWGKPQYMGIINTESWESQASFSPDGNTIYFSSARSGNRDLYEISRKDSKWGEVKSLGSVINTNGNEESPYMHPDGVSLYFMSNGHQGLGGMDIFLSKKQWDGTWSKPINLGPAINSSSDEGGLFVDLNGEYAYFSKTEANEKGLDSDIFRFQLPEALRPEAVTYVKIVAKDGLRHTAIEAFAQITESETNLTKNIKIPISGNLMVVHLNRQYSIFVEKENYAFHSENIDFEERTNPKEPILYDINLYPIENLPAKDTLPPVSLRNLFFETGKYQLLAESFVELDKLKDILGKNPQINILINGHTDNVGNPEDNLILSRQRAESVQNYLIQKGVQSERISIQAFGETQPLMSNETEYGRAMNRRIEFQIINP